MTDQTDHTAGRAPRRDLLTFDRYDRWGLVILLGAVAIGVLANFVLSLLPVRGSNPPLESPGP